jgi:hypothetical protein
VSDRIRDRDHDVAACMHGSRIRHSRRSSVGAGDSQRRREHHKNKPKTRTRTLGDLNLTIVQADAQTRTTHLTGIRETASNPLTQLGHQAQHAVSRPGRPAAAAVGGERSIVTIGGKKKRRRMSKAARANFAAAQRARWAKVRAAAKK